MTNEALNLMQSKQNSGPIMPTHIKIYQWNFQYKYEFYYFKKLHNINFLIVIIRPKNLNSYPLNQMYHTFGTIVLYVL
jgi:hypothetical protein